MLGSSRVAAQLAASQEGLSSMSESESECISDNLQEFPLIFKRIFHLYFSKAKFHEH
jgi:hypothetical protein